MSIRCEAVFRNSEGREVHVPFDVSDTATDADIEAAAQRAIQSRGESNGVVDVSVSYDVYVDRNNNESFRDAADHRIYRTGAGLTHSAGNAGRTGAGASPLTYRVAWARDQILRANMRNASSIDTDPTQTGTQSMASLESLSYTTDGTAGISREEARSFIQNFESKFGTDEAGRARLRFVLDQNPVFELGPDGNHRINDIYTRAGIAPPGALARPETGAVEGANDPNNPNNPNSAAYNALSNYISNPNADNLAALRRQKGATDSFIAELLARLAMGNTDVLTTLMDLVTSQGQSTAAQTAMHTIRALQALNQQVETMNARLESLREAQSYTGNDPARVSARNAANSEFQTVSLRMQSLSAQRSQLAGTLDSSLKTLEEERRIASSTREAWGAVLRASR